MGGSIGLRREIANSPDFWSILRSLQSIPEICPSVFSILEELVESKPSPIVADNYEAFVAILNEFATAGSIGAAAEQQHDQAMRKQKGLKPKPRHVVSPTVSST